MLPTLFYNHSFLNVNASLFLQLRTDWLTVCLFSCTFIAYDSDWLPLFVSYAFSCSTHTCFCFMCLWISPKSLVDQLSYPVSCIYYLSILLLNICQPFLCFWTVTTRCDASFFFFFTCIIFMLNAPNIHWL